MSEQDTTINETPVEEALSPSTESPNVDGMLDDISSDLFGEEARQSEVDDEVLAPSAPEAAAQSEEKPEEESKEELNEEPERLPDGWTKEALEDWANLPERTKAQILKREEDFHKGLESYKSRAEYGDSFQQLFKPYEAILQSQQIDPRQLVQSFAGNHYLLTYGTPEQKTQLAAGLLSNYGIDLAAVVDLLTDNRYQSPSNEITELRQQLSQMQARFQQQDNSNYQAAYSNVAQEVEAFAASHPYFDELSNDIEKFIKTGATLQEAYEKALWANPQTRQKELSRLDSEKAQAQAEEERQKKIAKANASNVTVLSHPRDGTTPQGTMDETLEETLAAIRGRG